jgi:hypothetical protein
MTKDNANRLKLGVAILCIALANIDSTYVLDGARNTGVAAGSITYEGARAAYILHFVEESSGKSYRVQHGSSQTINLFVAFSDEAPHARLAARGSPFAVELPAGTYVLQQWQVSAGASNIRSTSPTGIEFKIEPGKAIYLGNYHFRETSHMGLMPTGSKVTLEDLSARDLSAIKESFPALAQVPLTQSIAGGTKEMTLGAEARPRSRYPYLLPCHDRCVKPNLSLNTPRHAHHPLSRLAIIGRSWKLAPNAFNAIA